MSIMPSLRASPAVRNDMVKCCWTEERERALIAFYSGKKRNKVDEYPSSQGQNCLWLMRLLCVSAEHHCLWNKKSENHSNRQLKLGLLEILSSQLSNATMTVSGSEDRGQSCVSGQSFSMNQAQILQICSEET